MNLTPQEPKSTNLPSAGPTMRGPWDASNRFIRLSPSESPTACQPTNESNNCGVGFGCALAVGKPGRSDLPTQLSLLRRLNPTGLHKSGTPRPTQSPGSPRPAKSIDGSPPARPVVRRPPPPARPHCVLGGSADARTSQP